MNYKISSSPPLLLWLSFPPTGQVVERLSIDKVRFFRVERTYAVKTGKWYFEFDAVTGGDMRVGWARPGCKPDVELGTDELAFVFDGYRVSCKSNLNQSLNIHLHYVERNSS